MTDNALRRRTLCKWCGKEIAFIKTVNGKSIPVDPEPVRFTAGDDNERYVTAEGEVKRGSRTDRRGLFGRKEEETGYISHFATCPYADEARRRKNKKERTKAG